MKKIALTGGGTAGHVTPNIALIPALQKRGYEIIYIGSHEGIEKRLIGQENIEYFPIKTGKLRRYFSLKNITDMGNVVLGTADARKILKKEKVDLVFSKGGFVGLPVVMAASALKIPVIVHESDYSPGLANKLAIPFAKKVCVTFPETSLQIGGRKSVLTGNPVRLLLFEGDAVKGREICGFQDDKPILLEMGGSLGSKKINDCLRNIIRSLLPKYNVAHICGKGNVSEELENVAGYRQFEYINAELPHVLAAADIIVSRAGANAVSEFLALKKPNLLIPLSKKASRGDQILNAQSFQKQGYSAVLYEEELSEIELFRQIGELFESRHKYIEAMSEAPALNAVSEIVDLISGVIAGD